MTRDEIRSLIGGYATNSLSAAEQQALFEAALDDQELFDELANEQALKEMLQEPGVKDRLIGVLGTGGEAPRERTSRNKIWVWAATVTIAVVTGIVVFKTSVQEEKTVEIAQVTEPARPAPLPFVAPPESPRKTEPAVVVPPPVLNLPVVPPPPLASVESAAPKLAPPPATAEASLLKTEAAAGALIPVPNVPAPAAPANAPTTLGLLGGLTIGAPQGGGGGGGGAPGAGGAVGVGGGRGGRGGGGRALAQQRAAAAAPARFAFDYAVTPEGLLRITPAADGFLTVGTTTASVFTTLFAARPLSAGSVTEVMLPADATTATVIFAAQAVAPPAAPQQAQAGAADAFAPNGNAVAAAGTMDAPSGTKSDPNPSPNSRLTATIPLKR